MVLSFFFHTKKNYQGEVTVLLTCPFSKVNRSMMEEGEKGDDGRKRDGRSGAEEGRLALQSYELMPSQMQMIT